MVSTYTKIRRKLKVPKKAAKPGALLSAYHKKHKSFTEDVKDTLQRLHDSTVKDNTPGAILRRGGKVKLPANIIKRKKHKSAMDISKQRAGITTKGLRDTNQQLHDAVVSANSPKNILLRGNKAYFPPGYFSADRRKKK